MIYISIHLKINVKVETVKKKTIYKRMHTEHNFDNCNSEIITCNKLHNGRIYYTKKNFRSRQHNIQIAKQKIAKQF